MKKKKKKKKISEGYILIGSNQKKKKNKFRYLLPAWSMFVVIPAVVGILAFLLFALIPFGLKPAIGRGDIRVCLDQDQLFISWPVLRNASACRVYRYDTEENQYVLLGEYEQNGIVIPEVKVNEEILLRLQAVKYTKNWVGTPCEKVSKEKSYTIRPMNLDAPVVENSLDARNLVLTVNWEAGSGNVYEVSQLDEHSNWETVAETGREAVSLEFGDDLIIPNQDRPARISVRAMRRSNGCTYYSVRSNEVVIERDLLVGTQLTVGYEQIGERKYRITWDETRGDTYEVQQWSQKAQDWITKAVYNWTDERVYETELLPSSTEVRFRIVAYHEEDHRKEEDFTAAPTEISFRTELSPLYSTIWPIIDLDLYEGSEGKTVIARVPAGEALCVLSEDNGRFQVRYQNQYGYLDSRFCMINLPEYLGDLCDYDIKNSYDSVFRVHGYEIPGVTGTVVEGFENVCLGPDDYLVPYLYPCANVLKQAADDVRVDGYCLRIYEAFRPNEATRFLYDTMEQKMDNAVSGSQVLFAPDQKGIFEEQGGASGLSFRKVMTDNRYHLSAFLAQTISAHNRGIALDLTLETLDTKQELAMQTDMHDLSWYSCLDENNDNAELLAMYMERVGFNGLFSEWWHFQDDNTREEIGLNSYLTQGVEVTGWKKDEYGWKYRLADGTYYSNITASIDGQDYSFDADGYCAEIE